MSLMPSDSETKVVFIFDGLFFTLGKMTPPLRESVLAVDPVVWLADDALTMVLVFP